MVNKCRRIYDLLKVMSHEEMLQLLDDACYRTLKQKAKITFINIYIP
jgi:hypothetical protein